MTEQILWFFVGFETVFIWRLLERYRQKVSELVENESKIVELEKRNAFLDDLVDTRDDQLRLSRSLSDVPGGKELICELVAVRKRKGVEWVAQEVFRRFMEQRGKR